MNKNYNFEEKALSLIEKLGCFLEKSGYLPSAARVYALLMVWHKGELHFDEIQTILNLSKGATSKALNSLLVVGRIEIFSQPRIRKKFYKIKTVPGKESADRFFYYLQTMRSFLKKIDTLKDEYEIAGKRHTKEIDFFDHLINHIFLALDSIKEES